MQLSIKLNFKLILKILFFCKIESFQTGLPPHIEMFTSRSVTNIRMSYLLLIYPYMVVLFGSRLANVIFSTSIAGHAINYIFGFASHIRVSIENHTIFESNWLVRLNIGASPTSGILVFWNPKYLLFCNPRMS